MTACAAPAYGARRINLVAITLGYGSKAVLASYFLWLICYHRTMDILSGIFDTAREMKLTLYLYLLFIIALPLYARFKAKCSPAFLEKRIEKYPKVVSGFYFWGIIWISAFLVMNIEIAKLLQKSFLIATYLYTLIFTTYYLFVFYSIYCVLALKIGALRMIKITLISLPIFRTSYQFAFLYLLGKITDNKLPLEILSNMEGGAIKLFVIDLIWTVPWLIIFMRTDDKHIWEPYKKDNDLIFS